MLVAVFAISAVFVQSELSVEVKNSYHSPFTEGLELMKQIQKDNKKDLDYLKGLINWESIEEAEFDTAVLRLEIELEAFEKLKETLKEVETVHQSVNSALSKLIGAKNKAGLVSEAVTLLNETKNHLDENYNSVEGLWPSLDHLFKEKIVFNKHQVTVHKLALIYLAMSVDKTLSNSVLMNNLKINYPTPLPDFLNFPADPARSYLFTENNLWIPNAGYVDGGEVINGECRGMDYSGLISYIYKTKKRLSEMVLEYTARELMYGEKSFKKIRKKDLDEKAIRDDLYANKGLKEALEEFELVRVRDLENPVELKQGDLIVWRWYESSSSKFKSGHVVMFLEFKEEKILALELSQDQETDPINGVEGMYVSHHRKLEELVDAKASRFKKAKKEVYVLRRVY